MDSTDSTWMLSVDWPQSWRLCMCQFFPMAGVFAHKKSPLTWHPSSNSSKSTLPFPSKSTWNARQLGVEFCRHFVSQIALRTEKRHLIRYGPCNHTHTYWLPNQHSCIISRCLQLLHDTQLSAPSRAPSPTITLDGRNEAYQFISRSIHVWNTYYIWLIFMLKCREIYQTWMVWVLHGVSPAAIFARNSPQAISELQSQSSLNFSLSGSSGQQVTGNPLFRLFAVDFLGLGMGFPTWFQTLHFFEVMTLMTHKIEGLEAFDFFPMGFGGSKKVAFFPKNGTQISRFQSLVFSGGAKKLGDVAISWTFWTDVFFLK